MIPFPFRIIVTLLLIFPFLESKGQDTAGFVSKPVYLHASFLYDFPKSYGASAGVDLVFSSKVRIVPRKDGTTRKIYSDWVLNGDIGFYRYVMNHTGVLLIGSVGKRFHPGKSFYVEAMFQSVALRTFYDGKVYEVDNNNHVTEKNNFGRFYGGAGFATTLGWNLRKSYSSSPPILIQCQPSLWFQLPYNSFVLPHFSVQATIKYPLARWQTRVQLKEKVKK